MNVFLLLLLLVVVVLVLSPSNNNSEKNATVLFLTMLRKINKIMWSPLLLNL